MQRIELRLTKKNDIHFEDDERVLMRESYNSIARESRGNHQKNKISSISMRKSQNIGAQEIDSSSRKKKATINQDLVGIKVPKKESFRNKTI